MGQIRTLTALDFETQSQYIFSVDVTDISNNPRRRSARVTVNVIDQDDHVPRFIQNTFRGSVQEGGVGLVALNVSVS